MGFPISLVTAHRTHGDVLTAGTAKTTYATHGCANGKFRPKTARFVPFTTAAADASNYSTIAIKDAAGTPVSLGSITSATVANTAGTSRAIALTLTAEADIASTQVLQIAITKTGTGAVVDGEVVIEWERLPGDTF